MAQLHIYIYWLVFTLVRGDNMETSYGGDPPFEVIGCNLTSITIQWNTNSEGNISSYNISYAPVLMPDDVTTVTVNHTVSTNNKTMFTSSGLLPGTSYIFNVTAVYGNETVRFIRSVEVQTTQPQAAGLLLNGVLYGNNSIVTLDEIGEGSAALFCLTKNTDCCSSAPTRNGSLGEWLFPNETRVGNKNFEHGFYKRSGSSYVGLYRRNNANTSGVFRCDIRDASGANQQLYVGVYSSPTITGLLYYRFTLTLECTFIGCPATTVTWTHNDNKIGMGEYNEYNQEQMIVNTALGEYQNVLVIKTSAAFQYTIGEFTCTVTNVRGSSERSIVIEVIQITGHEQPLTLGGPAAINCSSDLEVERIEWLDSDNELVACNSGEQLLTLYVNITNDSEVVPVTAEWCSTSGSGDHRGLSDDEESEKTMLTPMTTNDNVFTCRISTMNYGTFNESITSQIQDQNPTPSSDETTIVTVSTVSTTPQDITVTENSNITVNTAKPENVVSLAAGVTLALLMFCIAIGMMTAVVIATCWMKRRRIFKFYKTAGGSQNTYEPTTFSTMIGINNYVDTTPPADSIEEVKLSITESNTTNMNTDKKDCSESNLKEQADQIKNNSVTPSSPAIDHSKDIPISEFGQHVLKMHSETDKLFELEYKTLSNVSQPTHNVASAPHNKVRNRFINIHPYDFSRVPLKEILGEEGSDYINASYIDGYKKPKAYIAAQGPKPNTVTDFWRMIWEHKLPTVVMLTRCFEGRKKCEAYWPEEVNDCIEPGQDLLVTLTTQLNFAEYTIRKMRVKCISDSNPPLEVTQFHFVGWPDHGVPKNAMTLINFIRCVRRTHPFSDESHLLVHCSAGVGRTGTFIVLDSMLQRMKEEDSVNVYESVRQLRTQRVQMVQTQAQYAFIHDAFNELIICGETEIVASKLTDKIKVLSETNGKNGMTGFEEQFQNLEKLSPEFLEENYSQALDKNNTGKNRYVDKLPYNFHRVYLRPSSFEDSDYINASFIDGYRQRGAYIATQGPLESTVSDFWRMMMNYKSSCIVMLCDLQEDEKKSSHCYWPTIVESSEFYGNIEVKLVSEDKYDDYIVRTLEVKEERLHLVLSSSPSSLSVTQFQFLRWPEHSPPQETLSLLELVENVNKVQMSSGNKAITVMCNDGVGRSGTFICIHSQLEQLKTEGVVDFFQAIKSARIQRAGTVSEVAQYMMCHKVLAKYLDSFETYANFKE